MMNYDMEENMYELEVKSYVDTNEVAEITVKKKENAHIFAPKMVVKADCEKRILKNIYLQMPNTNKRIDAEDIATIKNLFYNAILEMSHFREHILVDLGFENKIKKQERVSSEVDKSLYDVSYTMKEDTQEIDFFNIQKPYSKDVMLTPLMKLDIDYVNKELRDIYLQMERTKAQISFHNYKRVQALFDAALLEMVHVWDEIRKLGFDVKAKQQ